MRQQKPGEKHHKDMGRGEPKIAVGVVIKPRKMTVSFLHVFEVEISCEDTSDKEEVVNREKVTDYE